MEHLRVDEIETMLMEMESSNQSMREHQIEDKEIEEAGGYWNWMMKNETGW